MLEVVIIFVFKMATFLFIVGWITFHCRLSCFASLTRYTVCNGWFTQKGIDALCRVQYISFAVADIYYTPCLISGTHGERSEGERVILLRGWGGTVLMMIFLIGVKCWCWCVKLNQRG